MTKWYLKTGDSGTIAQGSTDFDFTKPGNIKRGDLFIARVGVRDGVTPAPVTSGDWTSVGSSTNTSNSTTGTGEAISQDFVWYHIYGAADPDWTFSRGGTTVCIRGAITLAPAIGYEFDLVETQTGTVATATTAPATANFTTTADDECVVVFLSAGRNATWSNWDATSPSDASGTGGYGTVGLIDPVTSWKRLQSNGTTSGNDISGSIGLAVKATAGATGSITVATNSLNVRPGWVGMRLQQVQATTLKVVNSGAAANYPTPGSVTIPFTPTSGNTLFAFVAIDKDATSDVTVTGWTRVMQERSGSAVGAALFRKVSDGTESSFDPSYTGSGSGENVFFIEIEGEVEIDVSATATTNLSTPAKTSGTATTANTTAAGGLALAFWANDSYGSCDTSTDQVFSNDFIMAPGPTNQQFYSNADAGTPAIAVGWKEIPSSGTAVSTAFTYTGDSDDENLLFLVVLKAVSAGTPQDGAMTKAATASETLGGTRLGTGAVTKAATSTETLGATRIRPGAFTKAATSGETMPSGAVRPGALSKAATSGETIGGARLKTGAVTDAATSGETIDGTKTVAAQQGELTKAAASGETMAGTRLRTGAVSDASTSSETLTPGNRTRVAALTKAAASAETLTRTRLGGGTLTKAATSGESLTAVVTDVYRLGTLASAAVSGYDMVGSRRRVGALTAAATSDEQAAAAGAIRPAAMTAPAVSGTDFFIFAWTVVVPTSEIWTETPAVSEIWTETPAASNPWS